MFKVEKLSESNFHIWKQKIELVLAFRELEDHITDTTTPIESEKLVEWNKMDAKARAVIGLTFSNENLEHIRGINSAKEMWKSIKNLFQRRTLLNRLNYRHRFYSPRMEDEEKVMNYISRIRQLSDDLKEIDVVVSDQEMAMNVLCGLPSEFEHLIVAIDAMADDEKLTMDFMKSRLLQEEKRI